LRTQFQKGLASCSELSQALGLAGWRLGSLGGAVARGVGMGERIPGSWPPGSGVKAKERIGDGGAEGCSQRELS